MRYAKYHGLGNDFIIINPADIGAPLSARQIQLICHRNYGIGADGILFGPIKTNEADFSLRIFNADGSEAEKSGNGLRVFSRYLWDNGWVKQEPHRILTAGGPVTSQVHAGGKEVTVEMGTVTFHSSRIPVTGPPRDVLNEIIEIEGRQFKYCAASIGNPHCVILQNEVSEEEARQFGPMIEHDARFPNKTNVQFMKVIDRNTIRIEIWERAVGYTLASGTSSSAAAAVARKLGLCDSRITVLLAGGRLGITVHDDFSITMTGSVVNICEGEIHPEIFEQSI